MFKKLTYEELQRQLEVIQSVSSLEDADIETIADHVLKSIVRITGSEYGFYGFVDEAESALTIHAWSGEAMKRPWLREVLESTKRRIRPMSV